MAEALETKQINRKSLTLSNKGCNRGRLKHGFFKIAIPRTGAIRKGMQVLIT
jgi:hypothetical protein